MDGHERHQQQRQRPRQPLSLPAAAPGQLSTGVSSHGDTDLDGDERYNNSSSLLMLLLSSGGGVGGGGAGTGRGSRTDNDPMVSAIEERLAYRDHSGVTAAEVEKDAAVSTLRRDRREGALFPVKLHQILSDDASSKVISWLPHGRAWKIQNARRLEGDVLPRYFGHGRLPSFMRQVNGWSFRRVIHGVDKNAYYHEVSLFPYIFCVRPQSPLNSVLLILRPSFRCGGRERAQRCGGPERMS